MAKFKVGDRVRVRGDLVAGRLYGKLHFWNGQMSDTAGKVFVIEGVYPSETEMQYKTSSGFYFNDFMLEPEKTPIRDFIVIRRDGRDVIASHKRGDEIVKTAKAHCNPSDEFIFETGAKLAFDRLMGREEPKPAPKPALKFKVGDRVFVRPLNLYGSIFSIDKDDARRPYYVKHDKNGYWFTESELSPAPEPPKFYTGKVVCTAWRGYLDLAGSIITIKDGFANSAGWNCGKPYKSFVDFCNSSPRASFVEIKE